MTTMDQAVLGWIILCSLYVFCLFGWDKRIAGKPGRSRISEIHLTLASAVGGWLGGLAGMLVFRHKTAKTTFKVKFALALLVWGGLLWLYWNRRTLMA